MAEETEGESRRLNSNFYLGGQYRSHRRTMLLYSNQPHNTPNTSSRRLTTTSSSTITPSDRIYPKGVDWSTVGMTDFNKVETDANAKVNPTIICADVLSESIRMFPICSNPHCNKKKMKSRFYNMQLMSASIDSQEVRNIGFDWT